MKFSPDSREMRPPPPPSQPWSLPLRRKWCPPYGFSQMTPLEYEEHVFAVSTIPNTFQQDDTPQTLTLGDRMAIHAVHHKIQKIQDQQCQQTEQLKIQNKQGNQLIGQSSKLSAQSVHMHGDLKKARRSLLVLRWIAIIFYTLYTIYVIVSLWLLIRSQPKNNSPSS